MGPLVRDETSGPGVSMSRNVVSHTQHNESRMGLA